MTGSCLLLQSHDINIAGSRVQYVPRLFVLGIFLLSTMKQDKTLNLVSLCIPGGNTFLFVGCVTLAAKL